MKRFSDKTWALAAAIIGSSLNFIDLGTVNIVLPIIQESFGAVAVDMQWMMQAYGLPLAALLLTGGALADRYGPQQAFIWGMIFFGSGALLCACSMNLIQLILGRITQGIGAAVFIPSSLALVNSWYEAGERGRAFGRWTALTSLVAALVPVGAGYLTDHFSWRIVFFSLVPLTLFTLWILVCCIPAGKRSNSQQSSIDWAGALLTSLGLFAVIFGLSALQSGPAITALTAVAFGILCLLLFFYLEQKKTHPMLPILMLKSTGFTVANVFTLFVYGALSSGFYFLPFYLVQVQKFSAAETALTFMPFSLLMFFISRFSGAWSDRRGAKLPLVLGAVILAMGFGLIAAWPQGPYLAVVLPAVILTGLGLGLIAAPLTTVVMESQSEELSGIAAAINNAVSRLAGLLAIALLGILLWHGFNDSVNVRLAALNLTNEQSQTIAAARPSLAAVVWPAGSDQKLKEAFVAAYLDSFSTVMATVAALAAAGGVIALFLPKKKQNESVRG